MDGLHQYTMAGISKFRPKKPFFHHLFESVKTITIGINLEGKNA